LRSVDFIYSLRLLDELLEFNKKGNFDEISALIMCMFQVQEEELGKDYNEVNKTDLVWQDLINNISQMYQNNKLYN
jgi:muramoyltetrapeptide carboxypeptidase LdcA involved in peptidoglycan recycling